MSRWEYLTIRFGVGGLFLGGKVDGQALSDHLNRLGEEGWELVSVFDTSMADGRTRDVVAVLKRPR